MSALPTWRQLNADVSPDVEAVQLARYRNAPAWEKLEMLAALNQMAYEIAALSLRRRHPTASQTELNERLAHAIYGTSYTHA